MFNFLKTRHYFLVDDRDVSAFLRVLESNRRLFENIDLRVGCCGWKTEPEKWFVHFDADGKAYDKILKGLLEIGYLAIISRPGGQKDLYFKRVGV